MESDIAATLRAFRMKHRLSQRAIGLRLGVSGLTVSRWEDGYKDGSRCCPSDINMHRILCMLNEEGDGNHIHVEFVPVSEKPIPVDGTVIDVITNYGVRLTDVVLLDGWIYWEDALHHDPNGAAPDPVELCHINSVTHWAEIPTIKGAGGLTDSEGG